MQRADEPGEKEDSKEANTVVALPATDPQATSQHHEFIKCKESVESVEVKST